MTDLKERAVCVNDTYRKFFAEMTTEDVLTVEQQKVPETKTKRKKSEENTEQFSEKMTDPKNNEAETVPVSDWNLLLNQ